MISNPSLIVCIIDAYRIVSASTANQRLIQPIRSGELYIFFSRFSFGNRAMTYAGPTRALETVGLEGLVGNGLARGRKEKGKSRWQPVRSNVRVEVLAVIILRVPEGPGLDAVPGDIAASIQGSPAA